MGNTKVGKWLAARCWRYAAICALIGFQLGLVACSTTPRSGSRSQALGSRPEGVAPLDRDEYSLKSDRSKLDDLRKEVPLVTKEENDELAGVLTLFQEDREPPYRVREKWQRAIEKRRTHVNRRLTRIRDEFNRVEKREREAFHKSQREARDQFSSKKPSPEERRQFFQEQEVARQDFRNQEREKRDDFERDVREKRRDFEDYVRSHQSDFDHHYRNYAKRFDEIQRAKREAAQQRSTPPAVETKVPKNNKSSVADELKEFEQIPKSGAKTLSTSGVGD